MDGPSEPQYWDTGTDSHSTSKGHIMTYPSTQRKQEFRSGTQIRCHCMKSSSEISACQTQHP